jgi:hypothetical protein
MRRSITLTPKRATASLAASVDPTDARNGNKGYRKRPAALALFRLSSLG